MGNATGSGGNTGKFKLAEEVVVLGERTFTFVDLDKDSGLVVSGGGETKNTNTNKKKQKVRTKSHKLNDNKKREIDAHLGLPGRDDSVTRNEFGHDTTGGLNTESEGTDIDEDDISHTLITSEDTTLDGSTVSDSLIGVDTLRGFLAEALLEELLNLGDTSRTTHEDDLIGMFFLDVRVLENLFDGLHGLPEEIHVEFLELGASERFGEVVAVLEALDFNTSRLLAGKGTLGLFDLTLEFTESAEVGRDIGTGLFLVLLDEVVHDAVVKVLTTKVSVTSGGQDLENTVVDRQEGNIEGTTTEIVDNDL